MCSWSCYTNHSAPQFPGQERHVYMQNIQTKSISGLPLPSLCFLTPLWQSFSTLPHICCVLPDASLARNYTLKGAQVEAEKIRNTGRNRSKRVRKHLKNSALIVAYLLVQASRNSNKEAEQLCGCNNSNRQGYS